MHNREANPRAQIEESRKQLRINRVSRTFERSVETPNRIAEKIANSAPGQRALTRRMGMSDY
jgi:hypothetical protein